MYPNNLYHFNILRSFRTWKSSKKPNEAKMKRATTLRLTSKNRGCDILGDFFVKLQLCLLQLRKKKQLSNVAARVFFLCYSNVSLHLLDSSATFHTSVEPTNVKSANCYGSVAFCLFWCNCHISVWAFTLRCVCVWSEKPQCMRNHFIVPDHVNKCQVRRKLFLQNKWQK